MNRSKQEILSLLKKEPKTFWGIAKEFNYTEKELIEELNELHKKKLVETKNTLIYLTEKGFSFTEKNEIQPAQEWGQKYEKQLINQFLKEIKNKPKQKQKFYQGSVRPEDSVQRAITLGKNFDVDSKNILLIGDDDLVSIALALTRRAKKIQVLEIDLELNDFINSFAEKNNFPLKAETWSVQEELNEKYKKKFDVFLTDPVETLEGIKLFLGRGMSALKGIDSAFYFGFTNNDASRLKWLKIQKMILNSGFIFTDLIKDQAFYPYEPCSHFERNLNFIPKGMADFPITDTKETYFRSHFVRCLAVKEIKPLIKEKISLQEIPYLDEEIF